MKIGFDVSDLCTGRADGTTRYTNELAKRFPQMGDNDWSYFAPCKQDYHNVSWLASPWPKYWTQLRLPLDLYRHRVDTLFMPIQQIPYFRPGSMRTVATVHDLAVHKYPEQFRYKDWVLLHVFSAQVAREADELIAVSQATADDIARYYGRTENVHVIHHGVDHGRFYVPTNDEKEESWSRLEQKYSQIKKPYILYVGQLQPRKNLVGLIKAFEKLKRTKSELQLVIAGGHGWLQRPIIDAAKQSRFKTDIIILGPVSDDFLTPLYWHAGVYVLPSLYEGFGMPILEAMGSGCPVVTANVSSMPEVAGGAAILVDPLEVDSIAKGIEHALGGREQLIQKGIEQASKFSWERTAKRTLEVLQR